MVVSQLGLAVSIDERQMMSKVYNKQLLDEVEHDIMNYQNRGLCYLRKPNSIIFYYTFFT